MCIEFDGHHSGGSSFYLYIIFLIILSVGHTHRYQFSSVLKKKNQVKSPSPKSRVPETGSDPPIGSGRGSGRDKLTRLTNDHESKSLKLLKLSLENVGYKILYLKITPLDLTKIR